MKTSVGTEKKGGAICTSFFFVFYYFTTTTTTRSTRKKRRRWRHSYYGKSAKCQDTGAEESVRFRGRRKGRRTAKRMKTDVQCNDKQFVTESASQVSFFLLLVVGSQGRSVFADPTRLWAKNKRSVCELVISIFSLFYYRFQNKSNVLVSFFLLYYCIKKRVIDQESIQRKESKRRTKKKENNNRKRKENTEYNTWIQVLVKTKFFGISCHPCDSGKKNCEKNQLLILTGNGPRNKKKTKEFVNMKERWCTAVFGSVFYKCECV